MKKITKSVLIEKVERLRNLTGNSNLYLRCCENRYGFYEVLDSGYYGALGSSGYNDMNAKEMYYYLDGLINGLTFKK